MQGLKKTTWALALVFGVLVGTPVEISAQVAQPQERPGIQRRIPEAGRLRALPFIRSELFFGTARPDGVVTEAEFRAFIDAEVTKRFPDGLTVLKGDGQFRLSDDVIVKEESFVLILLYPLDSRKKSSQKIEHIRQLYMEQFEQQSVLRVDDPFTVWVSF
jgi:hypothetical protein